MRTPSEEIEVVPGAFVVYPPGTRSTRPASTSCVDGSGCGFMSIVKSSIARQLTGVPAKREHHRSFLAARRAASPVASLKRWRGMLSIAKRRRSSACVSKSASMNISTVSSLACTSTRTGASPKSTSWRRPFFPRIIACAMTLLPPFSAAAI
jgi:hypothetical protein